MHCNYLAHCLQNFIAVSVLIRILIFFLLFIFSAFVANKVQYIYKGHDALSFIKIGEHFWRAV